MSPPLPDFFIVGTGKAGTTSLHSYLRQHPQIYMSPVKEPGYFATEIRAENLSGPLRRHLAVQSLALPKILNDGAPFNPYGWLTGDWQDYERLFQGVNGEKAIGESTAAYLWSCTAAANIRARVPGARIIMILRDPAERAFSQYLNQLSVGLTGATFRRHLEQCVRAGRKKLSHLYPFLEIGLYCEQVQRFLDLFPRDRIRIYWYEEAWRQPTNLLADIFRFLDVDDTFQPDLSVKSLERRAPRLVGPHHFLKKSGLWYPLRALVPERLRAPLRQLAFRRGRSLAMDPNDRRYLIDYYRDDIQRLAALLDRDLSAWLR
jgi:sulfotransferase family protein